MLDKSSSDCVCSNQLVLDGNIDIYKNASQVNKWTEEITNFIHK
jgi:hypothetical protein